MEEFDYIVVGAGSAGCVLANRLSENKSIRVCLIEAGPKDWNPWIHIPVGYFKTMNNPSTDWCYETEPDAGLNGRSLKWPRGRVLGGSSSINGLLYVRGQAEDYDRWRQLGNTGWGWDDVKPLFMKSEAWQGSEGEHRGKEGNLIVSHSRANRSICQMWLESAIAAGHPYNPDYNGENQEGVGFFQMTAHGGWRCSSAKAFLKGAKSRDNLNIITNALTLKIEIKDKRAVGVYIKHHGEQKLISAKSEVILSAGAINSPQLLMLSGIGEAEHLREMNIDVVHDAKDVGKKMQDHLQARLVHKCNQSTINIEIQSIFKKAKMALEFAMFRTGPMAMAASEGTGFLKTKPELLTPDFQFHIQPWSADNIMEGPHKFSAFTSSVCLLRPESRGEILLKSNNSEEYPAIYPNYLATHNDCQTIVDAVKIARDITKHAPLVDDITAEYAPGSDVVADEDILEWVRNTSTTIYHPTGTCRMGTDQNAVVSPELKVFGIDGLRVADASIMPEIISGNTNAPAIMIGEKCAELIKQDL